MAITIERSSAPKSNLLSQEGSLDITGASRCQHDDLSDIQPYTLEELCKDLAKNKDGLKTGYQELDQLVRIPKGALTLIAGRPSHGKTTFMLNLLLNIISKYPEDHFYFFSYEETRQKIALKIINILSGRIFKDGTQNLVQLEGYLKAGRDTCPQVEAGKALYEKYIQEGRLRIIEQAYSVQELSLKITALKAKFPVGAVFIDYIQKVKNTNSFGTRQLQLQNTSELLLETAKNCSVSIILGAQLGRDKENRDKVKLDNLRECGDLEQDASLVLGIFNPAMEFMSEEQKQLAGNIIDFKITTLKNRDGSVDKTVTLSFDRPILKIKDKQTSLG